TYRLRVDTLNNDGSIPPAAGRSRGYKAYPVRATDASSNPCVDCTATAWNDIDISTSVTFGSGNSFTMPLFALPPDYAGQTVTIDLFDPGDMAGNGTVSISIVDSSGAVVSAPAGSGVSIYNLGTSRTGGTPTLIGTPNQATFQATTSGTTLYNGDWVELRVPVPSTYNPGSNHSNWFWGMKYVATGTGATEDTIA